MPGYAERLRAIINSRAFTTGQGATSEKNGLFGKRAADIIVQLSKLLLASVLILATAGAHAGNITFGFQNDVPGAAVNIISGPGGSAENVGPVGIGSYTIQSLSAATQGSLAPPDFWILPSSSTPQLASRRRCLST